MEPTELEKAEEQRKAEEAAKTRWFKVVPLWVKLAVLALFALLLNAYMTQGGSPKKYLVYFAIIGLALWLWSLERKKARHRLTAREMMIATERELRQMKADGRLDSNAKWWVGPITGYKVIDSNFTAGLVGVEIHERGAINYYQAVLDAYDANYVNLQTTIGSITGREGIPTKTLVPQVVNFLKSQKLDKLFLRRGWE